VQRGNPMAGGSEKRRGSFGTGMAGIQVLGNSNFLNGKEVSFGQNSLKIRVERHPDMHICHGCYLNTLHCLVEEGGN